MNVKYKWPNGINWGRFELHTSQNILTKSMANVTSKSCGNSQLVAYLAWQDGAI